MTRQLFWKPETMRARQERLAATVTARPRIILTYLTGHASPDWSRNYVKDIAPGKLTRYQPPKRDRRCYTSHSTGYGWCDIEPAP